VSQTVGGYTLESVLGSGSFGTVWAARDPRTGHRVAVKSLDLAGNAPDEVRAQLHAEVSALRAVRSPYCLQVLDVIDEPPVLAMVTDYVEGIPLSAYLKQHGPLTGPEAAQVIWGAARGLAAVHAAGLIHGDVKPANILIDRAGTTRLIDFGLAAAPGRLRGDEPSAYGSPAYTSPEQARDGYRDARSDLYSLAVTMYELLCHRRPFTASTIQQMIWQQVHTPPPDPRTIVPELRPALVDVLMWGLAKDPAQRDRLQTICTQALQGFQLLTVILAPVLPNVASRVARDLFGLQRNFVWSDAWQSPARINPYKHLITRIDQKQINALLDSTPVGAATEVAAPAKAAAR